MKLKKHSMREWITFVRYRIVKQRVPYRIWKKKNIFNHAISDYHSKMIFPSSCDIFHLDTLSEKQRKDIDKSVDYVLDNKLPVLTDDTIYLGKQIVWNRDYVTNLECRNINQAKSMGADIKRVWELSRMHQLTPLMKAFLLTGDSRYTEKIKSILKEWIVENPYDVGPNWINSMEIAIRSANIIRTILLCPVLSEDQEFIAEVNQLLFWSGIHIRYFLENALLGNNNHYLSNLMGLAFIGCYFQSSADKEINKIARKWRLLSYKEINREIKNQILNDGTSFEKSTSYHAYVLEILLWSYKVLELNTDFDLSYISIILRKMYVFLNQINKTDGIPFIGDNDNSRLFRDDLKYPFENHRNYEQLLKKCKVWLKISDYKYKDCYKDSGYYFLKSNNLTVLVCCGSLSVSGGHCHNDQLSYILWYNGIRITDDPGTYCYTSDARLRNKFRGTGMHTTVQIENAEQNKFLKCFKVKDITNSICTSFCQSSFEGMHYGYKVQFDSVVRRRIEVTDNRIEVWDSVDHDLEAISRIILSPGVVRQGDNIFMKNGICFKIEAPEKTVNVMTVDFSPSYGIRKESLAIVMPFKGQLKYSFVFVGEDK